MYSQIKKICKLYQHNVMLFISKENISKTRETWIFYKKKINFISFIIRKYGICIKLNKIWVIKKLILLTKINKL